MKFEIFKAVNIKATVFLDVTQEGSGRCVYVYVQWKHCVSYNFV
jgi:hypothetical protein